MRLLPALLLTLAAPLSAEGTGESVVTAEDGGRILTHEILVPAPREAVWQAVATVGGWTTWAVPLARAIEGSDRFETSYDPAAAPGSAATIEQQWLEREAPARVAFRTTRTPAGFPHAETYLQVVSTFELEEDGPGSTRVRLTTAPYPQGEAGDALLAFFRQGNAETLEQLRASLAPEAAP